MGDSTQHQQNTLDDYSYRREGVKHSQRYGAHGSNYASTLEKKSRNINSDIDLEFIYFNKMSSSPQNFYDEQDGG